MTKLTDTAVMEIRAAYPRRSKSVKALAVEYDVSEATISRVISRTTFKNIPDSFASAAPPLAVFQSLVIDGFNGIAPEIRPNVLIDLITRIVASNTEYPRGAFDELLPHIQNQLDAYGDMRPLS